MGFLNIKFTIEKSIQIDSTKEKVWDFISDGNKKSIWSPWVVLDNDSQLAFEGNPGKKDYKEYWDSKIVGTGVSKVLESKKNNFIKMKLDFLKPFKSGGIVEFKLEEKAGKTTVNWKMNGELPLIMFFIKNKIKFGIGNDFERGLKMLKFLVEKGKLKTSTHYDGLINLDRIHYIYKKGSGTLAEVSNQMGQDFQDLNKILKEFNLEKIKYFTLYNKSDIFSDNFEYRAGIEISGDQYREIMLDNDFKYNFDAIETGEYLKSVHYGSYEFIGNTWTGAFFYAKANELKVYNDKKSIEIYNVGPLETDNVNEYETEILLKTK